MGWHQRLLALCLALAVPWSAAQPAAPAPTEISFARFFGSCEADFGRSTDPAAATGECGIITALVNRFNASNRHGIVVRTQVIEHGAYYSQLGARIVSRDLPSVVIMHSSVLNDFAKRRLLEPLDAGFAEVGINPADFTPQAERAVALALAGVHYALPFDTHSWLWHVNLNLLKRAGLTGADGRAVVPRSEAELLAQARQFKAATGKPYFILLTVNDAQAFARTVLTLVRQQGATLFPRNAVEVDLQVAALRRAVELLRVLYAEGLASRGHDYAGGVQAFIRGEGAVMINGTWLIGDLHQQAGRPGAALQAGYAVLPFPTLYSQPAVWADNHVMVMLRGGTPDAAHRLAALRFLKFLFDEGGVWARTGQLPTRSSVIESPAFLALPMRGEIASIGQIGGALPLAVARQSRVSNTLGDGVMAIVVHGAPLDQTLARMQTSITRMLLRDAQFTGGLPATNPGP
jgi:multiple sugar transport system substrate-binding protein